MPSVASTIQPEAVLKELAALWRSLSEPKGDERKSAVLRACSMTMIVVSEDQNDSAQVGEMLAALMHEHPSRAIVLRLASEDTPLEAKVLAQCWMPFGSREQICCEQIEITGGKAHLAEAPPAILGLTVADLPVVVFCRQPHLLDLKELDRLWPLADKVITQGDGDPKEHLSRLEQFGRTTARVGDLSWTRLTPWREAIAHAFDSPQLLQNVRSYRKVTIGCSASNKPVAAYYLEAWFHRILGDDVSVSFTALDTPCETPIRWIRLEGDDKHLQFTLVGEESVEVETESMKTCAPFRKLNEYLLLREELSILGADPLFDAVLAAAAGKS